MKFTRFPAALVSTFVVVVLAMVCLPSIAQTATPLRVTIEPSSPAAYEPFTVRVAFSTPNCWSMNNPVYSSVSFKQGVLSLTLSHLKPGPCAAERVYPVSGLPAGTHTIRLNVTSQAPVAGYPFGATLANEVGSAQVVVASTPNFVAFDVYTGRIDGDSVFQPFRVTEGGGGPVVLWLDHGTSFGSGNGDWLDVGRYDEDGYTFKAGRLLPNSAQFPPVAYEAINFFRYPAPSQGVVAATSAECVQLFKTWSSVPQATSCSSHLYVLKLRNGACPLGATPVYRLFHPVSVVHRYTQNADTYAELQNFGFVGEGPKFCAPARE